VSELCINFRTRERAPQRRGQTLELQQHGHPVGRARHAQRPNHGNCAITHAQRALINFISFGSHTYSKRNRLSVPFLNRFAAIRYKSHCFVSRVNFYPRGCRFSSQFIFISIQILYSIVHQTRASCKKNWQIVVKQQVYFSKTSQKFLVYLMEF
jgi:hypothetical protein